MFPFLRHTYKGLELSRQTYLFQLFSDTLDSLVMKSRAEGAYDEGICEIKGRVLTFQGDPEVLLYDTCMLYARIVHRVRVVSLVGCGMRG